MVVAVVWHPICLRHDPGSWHPERPERIKCTLEALKKFGLDKHVKVVEGVKASVEDILLVHSAEYIDLVRRLCESLQEGAYGEIDPDTIVSRDSYEAALYAAGCTIEAFLKVAKGEWKRAFALVRPPGHHAKPDVGAGFCIFNNIAIGVRKVQREGLVKRVAIVDWDAHHGDGTQYIFYGDDTVLYISLHQDPRTLYPGTGFIDETGSGKGEGYTINIPMPPGAGDSDYMLAFEEVIEPVITEFKPDIIAVSAGQDGHFTDPLTNLALSAYGYGSMCEAVVKLAEKLCGGKVVIVFEGGYSVDAGLPYANCAITAALAGVDYKSIKEPDEMFERYYSLRRRDVSDKVRKVIDKVKSVLRRGPWKIV